MHGFYSHANCDLDEFKALISEELNADDLRFAEAVKHKVPIYDALDIQNVLSDTDQRRALLAEWADVFSNRSGIVVLKNAVVDTAAIDAATQIFNDIIEEERAANSGGDHFGERGANDRVWNSLQKLCLRDPEVFARYFSSPSVSAVCEAWLGPWYQMTTQVNLVRPGGKAQTCHRDYHLGFMTQDQAEAFPAHVHHLSPAMTLQGAIAHCDMSIESGPTKLLPNSQRYGPGYVATLLPEFRQVFEENYIQLPLSKGDAIFFNPACFHAAGDNKSSDVQRMVNLMQIGSAMGRTLERIDRPEMVRSLFPALKNLALGDDEQAAVIAAAAEGYPFPTNLDTDPPIGGLASESQAELLARAVNTQMDEAEFAEELAANVRRRLP